MLAIFKLGAHQFQCEKGDVLKVSKIDREIGDKVEIKEILMLKDKDEVIVGKPLIENASIEAEIVGAGKEDKIIIYKYKRRTKYRRTQGHRQDFTKIKINKIIKAN